MSDWDADWAAENGEPEPVWNESMNSVFGVGAQPLRDVEAIDNAIYTLFWWRVWYDMEYESHDELDEPYFPPKGVKGVDMCSKQTRALGSVLAIYVNENYRDSSLSTSNSLTYYESLLSMIINWLET